MFPLLSYHWWDKGKIYATVGRSATTSINTHLVYKKKKKHEQNATCASMAQHERIFLMRE